MSDYQIRIVRESENRAAHEMFRATLHASPLEDARWPRFAGSYQPDRTLGAFEDDNVIGIAKSIDSEMVVPGGAQVPVAAVTSIGVRSDRTRRGVATALIHAQLAEVAERGVPLAALHASEAVIYGRHGYGVATQQRTLTIDRQRAQVREPVTGGRIELHDLAAAVRVLPELYARYATARTGMITRPSYLWPNWEGFYLRAEHNPMRLAVFHGVDGAAGYAAYSVQNPWPAPGEVVLRVEDMVTGTDDAFRGLWQYLIGVDLVDRIDALARPLDEPIEPMLVDSRACGTKEIADDVWLRLVDVPAALRARSYAGPGSVVIDVRDAVLPANSGRYRISAAGAERTEEPAGLTMDVEVLAMLYLGGWAPEALVRAGRIAAVDAATVAAAEAVFATDRVPWCGTFF
ncbi:MAG: GNAT family N-acetyltransferase [Thermocrispum sp.]